MNLAVKYRPKTFEDGLMGQGITATILKKQLEQHKFKNCYLFAGPSGVGKTTIGRCLAYAINNGTGEPIEIDAASNNGVDQVRAIIDSANQRAISGEYKIFIIDECHAITSAGWQAFLKGIEEPPQYTIFIFCTTEPSKIPDTILNRVQRYNLNPIPAAEIKARLEYICQCEGFTNYTNVCDIISRISKGCMREAITTLERCSDYSTNLADEGIKQVLGESSYEILFNLTWALIGKDSKKVLETVDKIYATGQDLKQFIDDFVCFTLDLAKFSLFDSIEATSLPAYLAAPGNGIVQYTLDMQSLSWFTELADYLLKLKSEIKFDTNYKTTIEIYLLNLCR